MAYDLEEQEQLATFKAFWEKYGNVISWVAIAVLASYAGYNFWNYNKRATAAQASELFDQASQAIEKKDNAAVQRVATDLESKFGSTIYAQMGALAAAKSAFEAKDLKTAKTQLLWVQEHGNEEYKSVAKLRMTAVLLDEKAYDEGLKLLATEFLTSFKGAVADRKGDFLAAQNKTAEARAAYQAALDALDKNAPGRQLIQVKLDAMGGSPSPAPAKTDVKAAA